MEVVTWCLLVDLNLHTKKLQLFPNVFAVMIGRIGNL